MVHHPSTLCSSRRGRQNLQKNGQVLATLINIKNINEYIIETKVLANQIENESIDSKILETVNKIESIKVESIEYIKKSNELRP